MSTVFISYAHKDKYFAELLERILRENKIATWRDTSGLRAGDEWRSSIDLGIKDAKIMVVALSEASCASHYVTYEWATGMALGKTILPVLLETCNRHPKLEPIQYLDFREHTDSTWKELRQRIEDRLKDEESSSIKEDVDVAEALYQLSDDEFLIVDEILGYMNAKGFRYVTLKRIKEITSRELSEEKFWDIVEKYPFFQKAHLPGKGDGLRLI